MALWMCSVYVCTWRILRSGQKGSAAKLSGWVCVRVCVYWCSFNNSSYITYMSYIIYPATHTALGPALQEPQVAHGILDLRRASVHAQCHPFLQHHRQRSQRGVIHA